MTSQKQVLFSWSGGKDSALALHLLREQNHARIKALLTTLTREYGRVSIHGVREELLEAQADSIGIDLWKVMISKHTTDQQYNQIMETEMTRAREQGIDTVAFADIFLEDLRAFREKNLAQVGMTAIFPIWKTDTAGLAEKFIDLGFKAVIACVDTHALDPEFAGRTYDRGFLRDLPANVDPCGENGEFHSFVFDGPVFKRPVRWAMGERVMREERFCFFDLVPD